MGAQTESISAVLDRAIEYVARYEDKELGNLLVAETYLQTAVTYYENQGLVDTKRQRLQSDFLMLAVGQERVGLRLVNRLNGKPLQETQKSFEALLSNSSLGVMDQIAAIRQESSRFNIGPVKREINVPTYALKVTRKTEAPRFSFAKREDKKVSGVDTWEIRFQEERAPTLMHGLNGESLLSSGSLWIEPKSGRILKTEIRVENPYSNPPAKAEITVTYKASASLGMLVPSEMEERYTTKFTTVTAVAEYSDYRLFRVDLKSAIDPTAPNP